MAPSTLSRTVGSCLCVGLSSVGLTDPDREMLERCQPGGVIIFRRNLDAESPAAMDQLRDMITEIQSMRPPGTPPLLVAIDQEGGRVSRLRGFCPDNGPMFTWLHSQLKEHGVLQALVHTEEYGAEVGAFLRDLGINLNFAPVVDILTYPGNTCIGDRALGVDALWVADAAAAYLRGIQSTGVMGCIKHFPGQGDARHDTHLQGTMINLSPELLWKRELLPFHRLAGEAATIMTSHATYGALGEGPASLCPAIVDGILHQKWAYPGIVICDDLNMHAIPQEGAGYAKAVVQAIKAGNQLLLVCEHNHRIIESFEALEATAQSQPNFLERLSACQQHTEALREAWFHDDHKDNDDHK